MYREKLEKAGDKPGKEDIEAMDNSMKLVTCTELKMKTHDEASRDMLALWFIQFEVDTIMNPETPSHRFNELVEEVF